MKVIMNDVTGSPTTVVVTDRQVGDHPLDNSLVQVEINHQDKQFLAIILLEDLMSAAIAFESRLSRRKEREE